MLYGKHFTCRLPVDLMDDLRDLAQQRRVPVIAVVREAIEGLLARAARTPARKRAAIEKLQNTKAAKEPRK